MTASICATCGVQFTESERAPQRCPVCEDARQYVKASGQTWTDAAALAKQHRNSFRQYEPGVLGIGTVPDFAIGQRALLVRRPDGNILWDCITLLDAATIELVTALGGLRAIAISHPHYYATMVDWSRAFGNVPIYLHAADREWVMRPDESIHFWDGDRFALGGDLTLVRAGGHFAGGTILHAANAANGAGALFSGDIVQVVADRRWVSFMRSYPNLIPLAAPVVRRIVARLDDFDYDRIYGAWWDAVVMESGKDALVRSADRYIDALTTERDTG